jgi:hypothetical protein
MAKAKTRAVNPVLQTVPTKYFDVKFDGKVITGKSNMGSKAFEKDPVLFSSSPSLMAIRLAMDFEPKSITKFMSIADGYGEPGLFPGGYDWSGIRDSSPTAVTSMFGTAKRILKNYRANLTEMGLPPLVVDALTK